MSKLMLLIVVAVFFAIAAASALGSGNPSGSGQPSQSCQAQPTEPGHAAGAPGSAFNEPTATSPGGTAGTVYAGNGQTLQTPANAAAVSQYDVACYQVSTH